MSMPQPIEQINVNLLGKMDLAVLIRLEILQWGDHLGSFREIANVLVRGKL